jgi:hypothetical protein
MPRCRKAATSAATSGVDMRCFTMVFKSCSDFLQGWFCWDLKQTASDQLINNWDVLIF